QRVGEWLGLALVTSFVTLGSHSMLLGALAFGAGRWLLARRARVAVWGDQRGLYVAVLGLALVMFLGIHPLDWRGAPVRGLYYYFYTYVPGFDGIRKVGRQAVLTSFAICVLAGFGGAWLFAKLRSERQRLLGVVCVLALLCYELRCFPHPLEPVWAGKEVPAVLRFVASLPTTDLVASVPQNTGRQLFRGDAGLALHNYLALYHQHRFVNGQSSWQPPVTELARRAVERLPDEGARRALLSMGARHVIVFGDDLDASQRGFAAALAARPSEYRRIFQQGADSVFTLLEQGEAELGLLEVPALPAGAQLVARSALRASASLRPENANLVLDSEASSYWTGGRFQATGQSFQIDSSEPHPFVALELEAPERVMDLPISFRISAARGNEELGVVAEQPLLRLYRAQIFTPKVFVLRVVLPRPILADRLVISVAQPVPGSYFSIHELRLYEAPP
ncbi:MAG TPA: hypothetical protein VEQ58_11060, partial [Polyangiaceae bacterium]|nr:hypothetical protein [Polyangiaceae bacterium]